jgi:hypothetical protein
MHKILGYDDSVNTCDCCGKTNLKSTVIVDVDGDILHYGSVCATRHTGKTSKEIKKEIDDALKLAVYRAKCEYESSMEYCKSQNMIKEAHKLGIRPGKPFSDYHHEFTVLAEAKKREIAAKWGIDVWKF